ncbi:MAG: anthranilate synthase component I family protein [Chitinophagaceae bacterium]|nr:anthranilate synthase component I family protein [Chitinophagaceae bacterium]
MSWASQFNSCCFLDNHGYRQAQQRQELLVAAGELAAWHWEGQPIDAWQSLDQFITDHRGQWLFGHLGYGLHQYVDQPLSERGLAADDFGHLRLVVPKYVVQCTTSECVLLAPSVEEAHQVWQQIRSHRHVSSFSPAGQPVQALPVLSRQAYLQIIERLRRHIQRGDCYEINFCQEFVAGQVSLEASRLYERLALLSPNPFSCYYRLGHAHLACASPERFLTRTGQRLVSQPIKGTARRVPDDEQADAATRAALYSSSKDRSENVMVVDLVRNDLGRICQSGSVKVAELFAVYSYPQVHQMISTIEGTCRDDVSFSDIIRATFPMGSMTGAPKKRVVELIQAYEPTPRGLFSGSVGYIAPNGDFDFNVVIRSIRYFQNTQTLRFHVGSGITHYSQPEQEYEECLLKAAAIVQVLQAGASL